MKLKHIAIFIVFMVTLGVVGRMDMKAAKLEQAAKTCERQTAYTVPTYNQCLSNQYEGNNDK